MIKKWVIPLIFLKIWANANQVQDFSKLANLVPKAVKPI